MMRVDWRRVLAVLLLASLAAACGPAEESTTEEAAATTPAVTAVEESAAAGDEAESAAVEVIATPEDLVYIEVEEGDGAQAMAGDIVAVHYTGHLLDGTQFDSSYDRGVPFEFVLGRGSVIKGWDEGIARMKEGGRARLIIPPHLAYGDRGAGATIPPGATLTFEVELVSVRPGPPPPPEAPTEVSEGDYTTTASGLKYYDLVAGDGATPEPGQAVVVHYTGWLEDGTRFDSSLSSGQPAVFPIGVGQVIAGWDEGVGSMRVGGQRQLVIPADLGYGAEGAGGVIPPDATLIFEVELLDIAES